MGSTAKVLLCLVLALCVVQAYEVCNDYTDPTVRTENIDYHIDRLMELRKSTWGWMNTPEAFLALQLSNQSEFFGRNKSLEALKAEMLNEFDSMNIGKLALYTMAVKSACENPRNFAGKDLIGILKERLRNEFPTEDQTLPESRWYRYSLAVGALCVCNEKIKSSIINKFQRGQASDGSFGTAHSVDSTSQALLALECINGQKSSGRIRKMIRNAALFLKQSVVSELNHFWIGNKYASPAAIVALHSSDVLDIDTCNVLASLDKADVSTEPESGVNQRLPALAGASYLDLRNTWSCKETVAIPEDYVPNYSAESSYKCNEEGGLMSFFDVMIEVTLKVYTDVEANVPNDVPDLTVTVDVKKGSNLLRVMEIARCESLLRFESVQTSWGASIRSVEEVDADSSNREYWSLRHGDGTMLNTGASGYTPVSDDVVIFKLSTW